MPEAATFLIVYPGLNLQLESIIPILEAAWTSLVVAG